MDIFQKRIGINELTEFGYLLEELNNIDLSILGEIKEISQESLIIKHKFLFIPYLKDVDFSKINPEKLNHLIGLLTKLSQYKYKLIYRIHSFKIINFDESKYKAEDSNLVKFIKNKLESLFKSIEETKELILFLIGEIKEQQKSEWKELINDLIKELHNIKHFCMELKHYSEFWKHRVENKPYIDASKIEKSKEYNRFYQENPKLRRAIVETENRIESLKDYNEKYHQELKHVSVVGYSKVKHPRHARIDNTFRIVYIWDPNNKYLKYVSVMAHAEMSRGSFKKIA